MNYQHHYNLLIERAKIRKLDSYVEKHHILPKCLGGDNSKENLVELTAAEHFVAHQLLVRIYTGNNKLVYALHAMCISGKNHIRNNKMYEWIRRENNKARIGQKRTQETKNKMSKSATGKIRTQEHKDNLSKSHLGQTPWNKGKKCPGRILTEDHKNSISKGLTGKKKSKEHIGNSVKQRKQNCSTGKDSIWYNNGERHVRCIGDPPDGFLPGRLFRKRNRNKND
jgi:hypothetical protein